MPVKNGIGIHDALWRTDFGGTLYQKSGSHGCINTPLEAMKKLYSNSKVGMPVIMYQ
jgi:lipoprotein-anchoring transpeptidase ErfK/SrfK